MKKFLSFCLRASERGFYFSLSTFLFILTFNKLPSHPSSGRRCQDPACRFHILEGLQLPVPTSVCGGPFLRCWGGQRCWGLKVPWEQPSAVTDGSCSGNTPASRCPIPWGRTLVPSMCSQMPPWD